MNQEGMKGGDGNLGEMREEANFICLAMVRAICFDKHEWLRLRVRERKRWKRFCSVFNKNRIISLETILLCFQ